MKQIKIKIKDIYRHALVAFFVDSPELEQNILELRKRLKLKDLIPYDQVKSPLDLYKLDLRFPFSKEEIEISDEMIEELNYLTMFENDNKNKIDKLSKKIRNFQIDENRFLIQIDRVLLNFEKSNEYREVLTKAIITGEVGDQDFPHITTRDHVSTVKRNRKWYWKYDRAPENEKGSYKKIAKENKPEEANWQTVEKAIKSYRDRLNKPNKKGF